MKPLAAPLTLRRTNIAFVFVLIGVWAVVLESMAVTVAVPAIAADFAISASRATWIMGMSQFIIVALLLPMASLGEAIGIRRLFLGGLCLFGAATVACILAPSFNTLILARAVQAIGTAAVMSVNFALARALYQNNRIGTAIGIMATSVAIATTAGPALSGLLLEVSGWRSVFGLMLLCSAVGFTGGMAMLPPNAPMGRRFDVKDAVLVALTLSCVLYVVNGAANGWPLPVMGLAAVAAALGFCVIARISKGKTGAVFPLDLLSLPVFNLSVIAAIFAFAAQSLGFVFLPFYLIDGAGLRPIDMALVLSIWPLSTALLAPILGWLSDRIAPGPIGAIGLFIFAAGFALLAAMPQGTGASGIALRLAACGIGFAVFQTPNNRLVMLSAPPDRSGAASGVISLARQFGRAFGTAIAAYTLTFASTTGSSAPLVIASGLALVGACAAVMRAIAIRDRKAS
ncbi:MFS transporter [Alphaproteobacteria bacterium KMM 3653]|uniref:MFS transporter n=1 Tax=Harenicola maris TaxID=2841044 RepID=A0AAP2CS20_9RHOB|nr:MFS transporter [Harenicola maris]